MTDVDISHHVGPAREEPTWPWFFEKVLNHTGNSMVGSIEPDLLSKELCSAVKAASQKSS